MPVGAGNRVRPEYGVGIRRQLSWNWPIYVNNADMKVSSCVADADADPRTPALLMENDYGFPVDVFPLEKGAVLPEPEVTGNFDQDIAGTLNRALGIGYIPGPGNADPASRVTPRGSSRSRRACPGWGWPRTSSCRPLRSCPASRRR